LKNPSYAFTSEQKKSCAFVEAKTSEALILWLSEIHVELVGLELMTPTMSIVPKQAGNVDFPVFFYFTRFINERRKPLKSIVVKLAVPTFVPTYLPFSEINSIETLFCL